MQFHTVFAGVPVALILGSAVFAAPATPEGAAHLTGVLQTYLGRTPGVVRVLPAGETYAVTVDFAPLLRYVPADAFAASMTPLAFEVIDHGDGTWAVAQDQSLALTLSVPGQMEISTSIGGFRTDSLFDENLGAFSSANMTFSGLSVQEVFQTPDTQGNAHITAQIAQGHYHSSSTAAPGGGVDKVLKYSAEGLYETMMLPSASEYGAPVDLTISAQGYASEMTMTGQRANALGQLLAWMVAHPSPDAAMRDQAALRAALSAALPIFENISGTVKLTGVQAETPLGTFSADALGVGLDINGVVADGGFGESFSVSGLHLPYGLLPPWAAELVPTDANLGFKVSGFDLAAPAAMLIGALDLETWELIDPAMGEHMLPALLPKGTVEVTLLPGRVASEHYEVQFQGSMTAGADDLPLGSARVAARGMDGALAVLSAAPAEISRQAVPAMLLVKGLANAEPDGSLVWRIDGSVPGRVLVNGYDVLALFEGR